MSRVALLMPGLKENPVWTEWLGLLESEWGSSFKQLVGQLANCRDLMQHTAYTDVSNPIRKFSDWVPPDKETLIKVCGMLGFTYPNSDNTLFSAEDYLRIAQNIASYYQEQGTESFVRFFSYCLNFSFNLIPQWTNDYVTFVDEGSVLIGTPIWNGGSWYPTSHVVFEVALGDKPPSQFEKFFDYIAPINLVRLATVYPDVSYIPNYIGMYDFTTITISNQSV